MQAFKRLLRESRVKVQEIFLAHPDWNARQIRDAVIVALGAKGEAPTLNAIQKQVAPLRVRYQAIQERGLDVPWHIGLMNVLHKREVFDITTADIPAITAVQKYLAQDKDWKAIHLQLTLRQARWVARLGGLIKAIKAIPLLWAASYHYSQFEKMAELRGMEFDTSSWDADIIQGDFKRFKGYLSKEACRQMVRDYYEATKQEFGIEKEGGV